MDDLEKRLKRLEEDDRSRWSSPYRTPFIVAALIGLGVILYFMNRQDKKNIRENGVLLPPVLIHKASPGRHDLALLNRDLAELAKEIDKGLSGKKPEQNKKKGDRYLERLHDMHRLGKSIEPRLTREEQRVLIATEHAEKLLEQFILGACGIALYDHALVEKAKRQIERAQALARGEAADALIANGDNPTGGGVVSEIKSIATGLKTIRDLKSGQPHIPSEVAYVSEIDGPRPAEKTTTKTTTRKKRRRKHHD